MANKKTTRRALFVSVMSLILCCAMLMGTTFAWFTDEAKSQGNIIQSGTLDIVLEKYVGMTGTGWANAEGQTINFVDVQGKTLNNILWEPGCTYRMEAIRVRNNGNLALKYDISLAGITGDTALLNAIEFTYAVYSEDGSTVEESGTFDTIQGFLLPGNSTGSIIIAAHMKDDAGNDYQNLKLEGISVVVTAQQYTYEKDSFNDQYDALIEAIESVLIKDGSRTQIGVNTYEFGGITDVNSFYVNILDQNGDVMTKITPTQKTIDTYVTNGKISAITACAVIMGDDSSSWDNTPFVPSTDKVPTKAVLYVNGVEKGSTTSFIYEGSFSTWQDVVTAYNNANP